VELGTTAVFGPGIRTDDDLAAIIQAAAAAPVTEPSKAAAPAAPQAAAADPAAGSPGARKRDKLKGALKGLLGWD
jgi:hypothetical protein